MRFINLTPELKQFLNDSVIQQWQNNHPVPNMDHAAYNLAFRALQKNYGDAFEHVFEMMQNDPIKGKFVHLECSITALIKENKETITISWNQDNALPVPFHHKHEVPLIIAKEFDEWKQYQLIYDKYQQWQSSKHVLTSQINSVLESFQDSISLVQYWPEFEPFFHEYVKNGIHNFPQR